MNFKKYLALLLAFLMLVSSLLVACNEPEPPSEEEKEEAASVPYESIIKKYNELLSAKKVGDPLPTRENETEIEKVIFDAVYGAVRACKHVSKMGYGKKDLNGDGSDELILLTKDMTVYAIFTVFEGETLSLISQSGYTAIDEEGTIYHYFKAEDRSFSRTEIKKIVNGALFGVEFGSSVNPEDANDVSYYKEENGKREELSQSEYNALSEQCTDRFMNPSHYTKYMGIRFIAAFPEKNSAKTADFSTLDEVLVLYRELVELIPEYSFKKWVAGDYDALYSFKTNESYEIFNSVLAAMASSLPSASFGELGNAEKAYGYAENDLDGDGENELILMTDEQKILAIFTQAVSGAKLIYADTARKDCFIDSVGNLHVSRYVGGETGRDHEYFLYELCEGELECLIAIGSKKNISLEHADWYKIENGKNVPIEKEQWEQLYAEYDLYPEIPELFERTKNYADLEFLNLGMPIEPSKGVFSPAVISDDVIEILSLDAGCIYFTAELYVNGELAYSLAATAIPNGENKYEFISSDFGGEIEFCVDGIWFTLNKVADEGIDCRSYFYFRD